MSSKIKYKNPSLIEAVCEIKFPSDNKWGMSSFIKFASLAEKAGFSKVIDAPDGFQLDFSIGVDKQPEMKPISRRIQTWNEKRNKLWQAAPELFAANVTVPYEGWEKFRPHILKGFEAYSKVAQPKKAKSLSMSFLNKIELDSSPTDYISFLPTEIDFADRMENFGRFTQQLFKNGDTILVNAAKDLTPNSNAVMLNIIYTAKTPSLELSKFKVIIETAHTRIISVFEKSITDKLREKMEVI